MEIINPEKNIKNYSEYKKYDRYREIISVKKDNEIYTIIEMNYDYSTRITRLKSDGTIFDEKIKEGILGYKK